MYRFRCNVAPEFESLIARTLAWNASNRPDAEELAAALSALAPELNDTAEGTTRQSQDAEDTSLLPAVKWPG